MTPKKLTLSDFARMEVIRDEDRAELIFGYVEGRPVRLMGYAAPIYEKDWDVREEGYYYFRDLLENYGPPGANLY